MACVEQLFIGHLCILSTIGTGDTVVNQTKEQKSLLTWSLVGRLLTSGEETTNTSKLNVACVRRDRRKRGLGSTGNGCNFIKWGGLRKFH